MYVGDDSVTETMNDILRAAFTEDKPILEATQRQEENAQAVSTVLSDMRRGADRKAGQGRRASLRAR